MTVAAPGDVLAFWFSERARPLWFEKDAGFDAEIRARFEPTHEAAATGKLARWEAEAASCLALVIALDQFPRNMYRGAAKAFAADPLARAVADRAVSRGFDRTLELERRYFFYLPFEHSEDLADQRRSLALYRALAEGESGSMRDRALELLDYADRHYRIVARFGRFPHRNAALGRETTPEEAAFLAGPGSSF